MAAIALQTMFMRCCEYSDKLLAPGMGSGKGNPELNKPRADTVYVMSDTGYAYHTDAQARVVQVTAKLKDKTGKAPREPHQQRKTGGSDRQPGDHGGHLIGSMLGGPGGAINLVAMKGALNTEAYRDMERTWERAVRDGHVVEVNLKVTYGNGKRPDKLIAFYKIDGVPQKPEEYQN